jgi:ABC-type dipeptide/oligopeptide/nickel transport system permease subunit
MSSFTGNRNVMKTGKPPRSSNFLSRDRLWVIIWVLSVAGVGLWNVAFLNHPALVKIAGGFCNTFLIATLAVVITLGMAWITALLFHKLDTAPRTAFFYLLSFLINVVRSIPQIVGILFAYMGIAALVTVGILNSKIVIFLLMAVCMSCFIMPEVVDLLRERIHHYAKLDFFNAMRVCGVSEWRIINFDIFWKNSRLHILNKLISIFGSAVFLQCSVDFIISVGLSTDVNEVTLPVTLGSLLAKMDSKQDILAIGNTITNPAYFPNLFFLHLQGITVAFLIVITLLSIYQISCGYAERNRL